MREKLLENIQKGLIEAERAGNLAGVDHVDGATDAPIWNNEQALKDIAKHVEPFKQFTNLERIVLLAALVTVHQANGYTKNHSTVAKRLADEIRAI